MKKIWHFPLLSCIFVLMTKVVAGQQCEIPMADMEFCNTFNSICLTTPDKLCLAESMMNCIGNAGISQEVVFTLQEFIVGFIDQIGNPEIGIPEIGIPEIVIPEISILEMGIPEIEIPEITPKAPQVTTTEAPSTARTTPQAIPTFSFPPTYPTYTPIILPSLPPFITERPTEKPRPWLITQKIPNYSAQPPYHTYNTPPPMRTISEIIDPISFEHIRIPFKYNPTTQTTETAEEEIYEYETYPFVHYYIDYLIALLRTIPGDEVQDIIEFRVQDMYPLSPYLNIDFENQAKDIEELKAKFKYVLSMNNYAIGEIIPDEKLVLYLETLYGTSMYQILVILVDEINAYFQNKKAIPIEFGGDEHYCHPSDSFQRYCERYCFDHFGGNWIGIQSRDIQSQYFSFDQEQQEYEEGFGSWQDGYWMGLLCLHLITYNEPHEVLIELTDAVGNTAIAHYDYFSVGSEEESYALHLGKFLGGNAGDSLSGANGAVFSAKNSNWDDIIIEDCAEMNHGGWWYTSCYMGDVQGVLNGQFYEEGDLKGPFPSYGLRWETWQTDYAIVSTKMYIRRVQPDSQFYDEFF